jgi:hypothetical protein
MTAPTLRSALKYYLEQPKLSEGDRAHIKRWLNETRDPIWERLAADTRRYGELPTLVQGPYSSFISSALRARQFAESQTDTPAAQRKRKQQRELRDRLDLLALANKMEEVVRHYQACKKAHERRPIPSPSGPLPPPEEPETELSLDWLRRKAHKLRELAEEGSASEPNLGLDRIRVHISRQSGGKGKRNRSREVGVFLQRMVNHMYLCTGQPRYDAVAAITNIAFPDANVVAENVRSACRPTTRTGRRRSVSLSPMK